MSIPAGAKRWHHGFDRLPGAGYGFPPFHLLKESRIFRENEARLFCAFWKVFFINTPLWLSSVRQSLVVFFACWNRWRSPMDIDWQLVGSDSQDALTTTEVTSVAEMDCKADHLKTKLLGMDSIQAAIFFNLTIHWLYYIYTWCRETFQSTSKIDIRCLFRNFSWYLWLYWTYSEIQHRKCSNPCLHWC